MGDEESDIEENEVSDEEIFETPSYNDRKEFQKWNKKRKKAELIFEFTGIEDETRETLESTITCFSSGRLIFTSSCFR